jgi:hypothetical protein
MDYLAEIQKYFKDTNSSEMSYRTPFQNFLETIFIKKDGYLVQHDQKAIDGNKPDFIVLKNKVPVLYIEVKKIGEDLDKIERSNQADRYFGYDNLIISDYVDFRFYRYGKRIEGNTISLGKIDKTNHQIIFDRGDNKLNILYKAILDFSTEYKEEIKSGRHLAEIMGGKALRIRENVLNMLQDYNYSTGRDEILKLKEVMRETLVKSLDNEKFSDMYAQTLVYGLFAARYNDKTPENFSRLEAIDLAPKTNPFLKNFFGHIAGASFPERLRFIVDELCEVFTHADVHKLLTNFYGKEKDSRDPIIHFYEDFLREYDSKKKMEMGVFYTPKSVVDFIIRGVDNILKREFNLKNGLSDTEKIKIKIKEDYQPKSLTKKEKEKIGQKIEKEKEIHKVQILDVATGTGTFLNEAILEIYKSFTNQEGKWKSYVDTELLPRLHGFELMMASYTIAHLKLGMTLDSLGIDINNLKNRIGIYLTNTLEEAGNTENTGNLFGFMDSIAEESREASIIKKDTPIMCVIGNPPYSGISQNKEYKLNNDYKVEIGGKEKLKERKNWLDDDYVKFIRFAESLIEKNGEGIIGMITSNGYIDNPTFRGMRWHLRKTFDKIYVLDLHGNSRKKETAPNGEKDENVFDIMTGVSIIFGIKANKGEKKDLADIYKYDLYGLREYKFNELDNSDIENIEWVKLPVESDIWKLEGTGKKEYEKGFSLAELFPVNTTGIVTGIDKYSIFYKKEELITFVDRVMSSSNVEQDFNIKKSRRASVAERVKDLKYSFNKGIIKINYRPFDIRFTLPFQRNEFWINSPRVDIMSNFINKENIGMVYCKQVKSGDFHHISISDNIMESSFISNKTGEINTIAPLYIYTEQNEKIPNLNKEIWNEINKVVGETAPENILDYIYAVLHSLKYRKKYNEFLKIDFPRVPYPENKETFWSLVKLGEKLRGLHLMADESVNNYITTYNESGTDIVDKIIYKNENVYINENQYFGNIKKDIWEYYIGGYQPAQKYLKDRRGRKLSLNEIDQYQRIIKVLSETIKIVNEIDF